MVPFETIEIDEMVTACNGGGGALGHPRVFLNLAPSGRVECPYCSRVFVNPRVAQPGAGEAGYSSVATPGVGVAASTVEAARDDERPPPRQP